MRQRAQVLALILTSLRRSGGWLMPATERRGSARSAVNNGQRTRTVEVVYSKKVKPTAWRDSLASHVDPANSLAWSVRGGLGSL